MLLRTLNVAYDKMLTKTVEISFEFLMIYEINKCMLLFY
jgi:hypothetical protein